MMEERTLMETNSSVPFIAKNETSIKTKNICYIAKKCESKNIFHRLKEFKTI